MCVCLLTNEQILSLEKANEITFKLINENSEIIKTLPKLSIYKSLDKLK